MRSPTQRSLTLDDIDVLVRSGLGTSVSEGAELTGGGFATVWRATLADATLKNAALKDATLKDATLKDAAGTRRIGAEGAGTREVVVKVGPPPQARLLEYEQSLLQAEAEYFRLVKAQAPGVPVPEVLSIAPAGAEPQWVITTLLPGRPLTEGDSPEARRQLGVAMAQVHAITGTHFGYTGNRPTGADWPTAFNAMTESLRADARHWQVPLPPLDGLISRHETVLAAVTRPALLHFDLWDGNILVAPDGSLSGVVDGERYLYGDPLLDLVSPALFRRIEDEPTHPFLVGYTSAGYTSAGHNSAGHNSAGYNSVGYNSVGSQHVPPEDFPSEVIRSPSTPPGDMAAGEDMRRNARGAVVGAQLGDSAARIRLALYRVHLYVLMLAEGPSRGIPVTDGRHDFLTGLLTAELKHLDSLS